jgi:hypothetical protein
MTAGPTSHLYYEGSFRNHSFRNFELKVDVMTRRGANGGAYMLTEYEQHGGKRAGDRALSFEGLRDPGQRQEPRQVYGCGFSFNSTAWD